MLVWNDTTKKYKAKSWTTLNVRLDGQRFKVLWFSDKSESFQGTTKNQTNEQQKNASEKVTPAIRIDTKCHTIKCSQPFAEYSLCREGWFLFAIFWVNVLSFY